jgi:hypothetical protein
MGKRRKRGQEKQKEYVQNEKRRRNVRPEA